MDCQAYQRWLSPYIDGALGAEERGQLEAHLAACPRCQAELVSLRRMLEMLKTMEQPPAPDLVSGVHRKLTGQPWWRGVLDHAAGPWSVSWHQMALAGTAAVAIVAVGIQQATRDRLSDGVQISVNGYEAPEKKLDERQKAADVMMNRALRSELSQDTNDNESRNALKLKDVQDDGDLRKARLSISVDSAVPVAQPSTPGLAGNPSSGRGQEAEEYPADRSDRRALGGDVGNVAAPIPEEGAGEKLQAEQVSTPPMGVTVTIPARENGQTDQAKMSLDESSCNAQGGVWAPVGMRRVYRCNQPTKDAEKPCTDGSECESRACIADQTIPSGQSTTGRCYGWTLTLGTCLNRVSGGQASGVICED